MDVFTPAERSRIMSRIRSTNTRPELLVRRLIYAMDFRYRLHRADLPGRPDLVFPSRKKVIFVNGCFWHRHQCQRGRRTPKTNADYWIEKRTRNAGRDQANRRRLRHQGWDVLTVWECQLKDVEQLRDRLLSFLNQ